MLQPEPESKSASADAALESRVKGLFGTEVALGDGRQPLKIWQDPLGKWTKLLGHSLYPAAIAFVEYVSALPDGEGLFGNKNVIEIGAGLGAPGLAIAKLFKNSRVTLTDLPGLVPLLDLNIAVNFEADAVDRPTACELAWGDTLGKPEGHWDWIIGADVVYAGKHQELIETLLMECSNRRCKVPALHCCGQATALSCIVPTATDWYGSCMTAVLQILLSLSDRKDPTEGVPLRRFMEHAAEFFRSVACCALLYCLFNIAP